MIVESNLELVLSGISDRDIECLVPHRVRPLSMFGILGIRTKETASTRGELNPGYGGMRGADQLSTYRNSNAEGK